MYSTYMLTVNCVFQASEQDILIAVMKWGEAQVYKEMNPGTQHTELTAVVGWHANCNGQNMMFCTG